MFPKTKNQRKEQIRTVKSEALTKKEISFFIGIVAFFCIFQFFFKTTLVSGESMLPTYTNRELLLLSTQVYNKESPSYQDVIVFELQENNKKRLLVKRVIGEEGDQIKIHEGKVYRNNQLLKESYIAASYTEGEMQLTVPKNHVFVMGDNRNPGKSLDSRYREVGFIHKDQVKGKIVFSFFHPFEKQ